MYLKLLYLMYVAEIKFSTLKLIFVGCKPDSYYIIRTSSAHVFFVVHFAPKVFVDHKAQKHL